MKWRSLSLHEYITKSESFLYENVSGIANKIFAMLRFHQSFETLVMLVNFDMSKTIVRKTSANFH